MAVVEPAPPQLCQAALDRVAVHLDLPAPEQPHVGCSLPKRESLGASSHRSATAQAYEQNILFAGRLYGLESVEDAFNDLRIVASRVGEDGMISTLAGLGVAIVSSRLRTGRTQKAIENTAAAAPTAVAAHFKTLLQQLRTFRTSGELNQLTKTENERLNQLVIQAANEIRAREFPKTVNQVIAWFGITNSGSAKIPAHVAHSMMDLAAKVRESALRAPK